MPEPDFHISPLTILPQDAYVDELTLLEAFYEDYLTQAHKPVDEQVITYNSLPTKQFDEDDKRVEEEPI